MVVSVKAAEITDSTQYGAGWTVRFPRFMKFRDDKTWQHILTHGEMLKMKDQNAGKLASKRAYMDTTTGGKRKVEKPPRRGRMELAPHLKGANLAHVVVNGALFVDKTFYVVNVLDEREEADPSATPLTKQSLEILIAEKSGTIIQSLKRTLFCVIADEPRKAKVPAIIRTGEYDVVHSQWVIDSLQAGKLIPFEPKYMLMAKPETAQGFARTTDEFSDSYTDDVTAEELLETLGKMSASSSHGHSQSEFSLKRSHQVFSEDPEWGLFERVCVLALAQEDVVTAEDPSAMQIDRVQSQLLSSQQEITLAKMLSRAAIVHPTVITLPSDIADSAILLKSFLDAYKMHLTHVLLQRNDNVEREWANKVLCAALGERSAHAIKLVDTPWVNSAIEAGEY